MRTRVLAAVAAVAACIGLATSVASPIAAALRDDAPAHSTSVEARGRITR